MTYFCHSCNKRVDNVNEDDNGVIKCIVCGEEYVEIVESENEEQELSDFIDEQKQNNNNQNNNTQTSNNNNNNSHSSHMNNNPFQQLLNTVFNAFNPINNINNSNIHNSNNAYIFRSYQFGNIRGGGGGLHFGDYAFGDNDLSRIIQDLMERDINQYGPPPASKNALSSLKDIIFVENKDEDEQKLPIFCVECAICKDKYLNNDKLKELPCQHRYHGDCIEPWLKIHNTCPVCRYEMPTDDAVYEQIRQRRTQQQSQHSNNNNNNNNENDDEDEYEYDIEDDEVDEEEEDNNMDVDVDIDIDVEIVEEQ